MPAELPAGLAILGPTGCGKSALAMQLAAALPVEIISVDSAQVYRGMDIGTAKPTPAERQAVPHHLIDIRDPEQAYSAGEFRADALRLIDEISGRGRIPLLVGGTMLYYRALFQGIAELPQADADLRRQIDARAAAEGWPALHAELAAKDPGAATRIHPNDAQRIQRALELIALTGRPLEQLWEQEDSYSFSKWNIVVLEPADRSQLHAVIARRFEAMMEAGLADEVRTLLARPGMSEKSHTMRLVGYRQLAAYVAGRDSLPDAVGKAMAATRQLAKRQLTWLRGQNLLPSGASVQRVDPFDDTARNYMTRVLIEGPTRA
jgi:tRNA dimethylallyltransferase